MERNGTMERRIEQAVEVMVCMGVQATIFPLNMIEVTLKSADKTGARYTLPAEMAGQFTVGASYRVILPGVSV